MVTLVSKPDAVQLRPVDELPMAVPLTVIKTDSRIEIYEHGGCAEEFDVANPEVWGLFVKFANEVMRAGHKRYSSDAILHRIRWHSTIEVHGGKPFKLNDHFTWY